MNISVSFSGGLSHEKDIPEDRQSLLAEKIAHLVRAVVEANGASGTALVTVGRISKSVSATAFRPAD